MRNFSPADAGALLEVAGVDLVRDGKYLLSDISLTIRSGEHWALLGANGAGKSTLLSLLGARNHPTRGTVTVLGQRLGRVDLRELRTYLGHVDPRHPLQSPLTLREVVLTGLTNTTEIIPRWAPAEAEREQAERLIEVLGIAPRAEARWQVLSQGERGRALIARALMPKPRLLLLDEPATGLDLAAREQLIESLDALKEEHPSLATVLVTHHLEELPPGTTHGMLLRAGICQATGPIDEVLTSESVSECFGHPVTMTRIEGRWSVRTRRSRLAA